MSKKHRDWCKTWAIGMVFFGLGILLLAFSTYRFLLILAAFALVISGALLLKR